MKSSRPYQARKLAAGRSQLHARNLTSSPRVSRQGGMGTGVRWRSEIMGRGVRSILPLDKSDDLARESFFHREIRLQATLDCPYLVPRVLCRSRGQRAISSSPKRARHRIIAGSSKRAGRFVDPTSSSIIASSRCGVWPNAHEHGVPFTATSNPATSWSRPNGSPRSADGRF